MSILWLLIGLSSLFWILAIWAFFWGVDHQQLEHLDQASHQALDLQDAYDEPVSHER